ncbi:MAG: RcnB family protein [Polaromonas sp.]|nr:RcnB family protein [Polaromonas sp.]
MTSTVRLTAVAAMAAASLGFASLSFAQGYDNRGPRGDGPRYDQRGPGQQHRDLRQHGPRGVQQPQARNDRHGRYDRHDRRYGARGPQFYRGGHLPNEYRGRQYVVQDWRGHHLRAPQRGQQWIQVGADYALIAIATGVIAQLVLNN